ncbi:transglutaminase-like domain-containing protein [Geobacter argillaceus]|uniref:Transglutaminase superfamily protein n=1 Tax=Geobacter argillaceus TaxID=345631 RepID=A0A562VLL5_9BACT|nr:transglutaminase-like domain-containing protein [Geobacter argillaceus]TWJ18856.1 transglutaminase superfamily protein [Geobacter argillaceus]
MSNVRTIATGRVFPGLLLFVLIVLTGIPCLAGPKGVTPLTTVPVGERWFAISMGGERVGFARLQVEERPDGYWIASDSSARMVVLGFTREASAREEYLVNRDLTLRSFSVEQVIDKSPMKLRGKVEAKGVRVTVETADGTKEKLLKAKAALYPPPVLNLYPMMKGVVPGRKYRLQMLDVESVKVKDVSVEAVALEKGADGGELIHLRNDLYSLVDNDIWLDKSGNTVRESVRDGLILTVAEEREDARRALLDAAVSRRDFALDYSLIRLSRPIERPAELKRLVVLLTGVPEGMTLPDGGGQQFRREGGSLAVTVIPSSFRPEPGDPLPDGGRSHLQGTLRIIPDHQEIRATAARIVAAAGSPAEKITLLTSWVAKTIGESVSDSQSPVETLEKRTGNCQAHARLYASLARSAGIPTRFVSGLVYLPGKGFLYHSWAESYAGQWVAVDPTFGQVPADATHIKLAEGDGPDDMAVIAGLVGRLGVTVVEAVY